MHDIKAIRDDEDGRYLRGWTSRGVKDAGAQLQAILKLDAELRAAQTSFQAAQARRNELSKQIGQAKAQKDEARAQALMAEVEGLKAEIDRSYAAEGEAGAQLKALLAGLPNLPADDTPVGADEADNVEVSRWSDRAAVPAGRLNATPRDHVDLGAALGMMDFEAAAKMSGARFVVLKSRLARLERALGQFMLDQQTTKNGYLEVSPPLLVNDDAMFGTGQLPKFAEDLFSGLFGLGSIARYGERVSLESRCFWEYFVSVVESIRNVEGEFNEESIGAAFARVDVKDYIRPMADVGDLGLARQFQEYTRRSIREYIRQNIVLLRANLSSLPPLDLGRFTLENVQQDITERLWLIPTAEVSLTNLVREAVTDEAALPLRLTALTPCFRSEAGASGRDTRGMIRQHQFWKCELVCIAAPEASEAEHAHMVASAQGILEALGLPYRTMALCTGDMGFTAKKTFDLEVWLPSQNTYREISSISNCGDFQARRMDARIRKAGEKGTRFPHTLNSSGLAVGRTLVAILENYQDEGGRIAIPTVLQPYMDGATHIGGAQ